MNRFRFLVLMAWVAALLFSSAAFAQSPANISIVSGNGQMICQLCLSGSSFFQPLVVRVTDSNGSPLSGVTVNWQSSGGGSGSQLQANSTFTDNNGISQNTFFPGLVSSGSLFQSYLQANITATAGSASTSFTETQLLQDLNSQVGQNSQLPAQAFALTSPPAPYPSTGQSVLQGTTLTGQVGSQASVPFVIRVVDEKQTGIPNVAVNIFNFQTAATGPVVQCGGPTAVNGTVLTDASGVALCYPVFSGIPNVTGQFEVVVGGIISNDPTVTPQAYWFFPIIGQGLAVRVTPGTPGSIRIISGNTQSAQAGSGLPAQLVVEVDSTVGGGLAGQTVNWTASPAAAATFGRGTSTTTDANGQTSNVVAFAPGANGAVQITATLSSDTTKKVTFTETAVPNVSITGLSIVSGSNQSAIVNTAFPAPLVVQVSASNGTAVGVPVLFTVSGPGILSATTVNTNSSGQASVNVTASGTPGAITVTASAGAFSQTFNLTAAPPGPTLTAASFVNAGDFQRGSLSPCSLATVIATGLAPSTQTLVSGNTVIGPLQATVAGDTVTVGGFTAPIASVGRNAGGQEELTFQVPCEVTPGSSVAVAIGVGPGSATINIPIQQASPGLLLTQMSDGQLHPVLIRPDGTFVSIEHPARKGDSLIALVTGLGPSSPVVGTNSVPGPGAIVLPQYTITAGMGGVGGVPVTSVQLSPDQVGVWMVTFQVPTNVSAGNVAFSVGVVPTGASAQIPSATSTIPVQ